MLNSYRLQVERELERAIERLGEPSRLRDACSYALLSGGKRLRPILVLLIGEAIGKGREIMAASLSVEYFHTASLIADDLPCMDNDDLRRNKPTLHRVFEESVAILASYTLIAAGYGGIYDTARLLKERAPQEAAAIDATASLCLEAVTRCAGLRGATHGQFLDLFPPNAEYPTIRTIIERKTVTLFEISFVLGWLFGGGAVDRLEEVKQCASHLGFAFQIADDLQDVEQDSGNNIAIVLGIDGARKIFQEEFDRFVGSLKSLGLWSDPFREICDHLLQASGSSYAGSAHHSF